MFGPVAFVRHRDISQCFVLCHLDVVEDTYIQHYGPVLPDVLEKMRVVSVEVDMTYPPEQRQEEEGALNDEMKKKRIWQMETLMNSYRILAEKNA